VVKSGDLKVKQAICLFFLLFLMLGCGKAYYDQGYDDGYRDKKKALFKNKRQQKAYDKGYKYGVFSAYLFVKGCEDAKNSRPPGRPPDIECDDDDYEEQYMEGYNECTAQQGEED